MACRQHIRLSKKRGEMINIQKGHEQGQREEGARENNGKTRRLKLNEEATEQHQRQMSTPSLRTRGAIAKAQSALKLPLTLQMVSSCRFMIVCFLFAQDEEGSQSDHGHHGDDDHDDSWRNTKHTGKHKRR